jgi:hypothetical protein
VLCDNLFGDAVIGLRFEPSLSLFDASQATFRPTSAFVLQAFAQSCVMVGLVSCSFPWMKAGFACRGGSDREIADTYIHPDDFGELFAGWLCYVNREGHEQIECLLSPVIPEFRITYGGSLLDECDVLVVALVGDADPSVEGPDAQPAVTLKGVIPLVGVLHGGGTVMRRLVQSFEAFFRDPRTTMFRILQEPGPQPLVRCRDLPFDATGQLRGKTEASTQREIHAFVQLGDAAGFAVREGILTHRIEGIAIRQLGLAQCLHLLWCHHELELGGDDLLHADP